MSRSILDKLVALRDERRDARTDNDGGFTLIELLVVVVIIGILIAIAIPLYLNYQKGAKDKGTQSDIRAAVSAVNQCYTDNSNTYPSGVTFSGTVGTPAPSTCSNDVINLSSGTTMVYTATPASCTTACTGYTLAASNSGGNHNAVSSVLSAATTNGSTYYWYSSATGGQISGT